MKKFFGPLILLIGLIGLYYQFFFLGKIPIPADLLVGAYFPWLDQSWGFVTGVPVKNPPITDVISQLYIWRTLGFNLISQGIWPLWNPYSASGTPLLANFQSAPFLPFNILLFLPKYFGWGIYIFSQSLFGALGMYLLLGRYKLGEIPRIIGAVCFCLSGLMSTYIEFAMAVFAASTIPWIFFSLESYWQQGKVRFLALLTFSFATLYLSGHAQLAIFGTLLFFSYFLIQKKQKLILPTISWVLALGIACLQLLPTADYILSGSIRGSEAYSTLFNYGLVPWYESIRMLAADFFGNPTTYNYWGFFYYHDVSVFLGTLTVPFLLPLLFKSFRNQTINFWGAVFITSIVLGFNNPISHLLYSLPVPFLTNSSASRIFFITTFSASILLAFSLQKFYEEKSYSGILQKSNLFVLGLFVLILLGIGLVIFKHNLVSSELLANLKVSFKNSLLPVAILLALAVILKFIKNKKIILILVLVILFFDLGRYFLKHNPFVDQKLIYPQTPLIAYLQNQSGLFRIARADAEIMPPNTWIPYGLSSVEGYDPLSVDRYSRLINRANGSSFAAGSTRYVEVKNYPSKFLDALNVKYFLAVKRDQNGKIKGNFLNQKLTASNFKTVFEDQNSVVLENPDVLNRAFFVKSVNSVQDEEELSVKINDSNFDPTTQALIEGGNFNLNLPSDGQATITQNRPNNLTVETETSGQRFLVLSDTYEKGWTLTENGQSKKLYRTDGAIRGFFVSPGKNVYRLSYWPESFSWGLKISLISLLGLILIVFLSVRKKQW